MVDERASPSAGWRKIYDEMGVDDAGDEGNDPSLCPDCGLVVARDEEHRCPLVETEQSDEDVALPVSSESKDD